MAHKTPTPEAQPPVIDWAGLDWLVRTRLPEQLDTLGFHAQAALIRDTLPPIVDYLTADLARRLERHLRHPIAMGGMAVAGSIELMPDSTEEEYAAKLIARSEYTKDARRTTAYAAIGHAMIPCQAASELPDPPRHTLEYVTHVVTSAVESERLRPLRGGGL